MSQSRAKKQRAARSSVAAARRSGGSRAATIAGAVIVLVLVAAVAIGFTVEKHRRAAAALAAITPVTSSASAAPVAVDRAAGAVVVGTPSAKTTVDVYEDALCPICGAFEHQYGEAMRRAMTAGTLRVRYHLLNLLDDRSSPPGYSLRAATAALAVAAQHPHSFMSFHDSLFGAQPEEGSPAYTTAQLDHLATELGAAPDTVTRAVDGHTFDAAVQGDLDSAMRDAALRKNGGFGTPTVAENGRRIDITSSTWLSDLTAAR
jgi:protein-disulfide isomerase